MYTFLLITMILQHVYYSNRFKHAVSVRDLSDVTVAGMATLSLQDYTGHRQNM